MLKKFTVKNYKNFKDEICLDFGNIAGYQFSTDCLYEGLISKILIYGRNADGENKPGKSLDGYMRHNVQCPKIYQ